MLKLARAEEYLPLKVEESEDNVHTGDMPDLTPSGQSHLTQRPALIARLAFYISLFLNLILMALLSYTAGVISRCGSSSSLFEISSMFCERFLLYSIMIFLIRITLPVTAPARDIASRNIERKFPHLLDTSIYMQPPSDEVDQAWSDLYNCKSSKIFLAFRSSSQKD